MNRDNFKKELFDISNNEFVEMVYTFCRSKNATA